MFSSSFGRCLVIAAAMSIVAGEYWTERRTKGALSFAEHSPKVARSHADAVALFAVQL